MKNTRKNTNNSKQSIFWIFGIAGVLFISVVHTLFNQTDMRKCTNYTLVMYSLPLHSRPLSKNKIEYTKYKIDLHNVKIHDTGFKFGRSHICEVSYTNQSYRLCFVYNEDMDSLASIPCPGTNEDVVEASNAFMEYYYIWN